MKRKDVFGSVMMLLMVGTMISPLNLNARDEVPSSPFSVGGDLVSNYIWRGTKLGTGPAIQPYLELSLGGFSIGGWGSYCFTSLEAPEADLYASYSFNFGLSLGMTDYYFPGTQYFDYSTATGAHAFEINLGYEIAGISIGANYMLNEAGGAGSAGKDLYFELGYGIGSLGVFVGAGNGWHTAEDPLDPGESDFNLCNIGVSASREIKISESFSLPVSGSLILNPDTEQFYVVVAVSF